MPDNADVMKEATRIASFKMQPVISKITAKIGDYDIERVQTASPLDQLQTAPALDPTRDSAQDASNFLGEFGVTVTKR